MNLQKYIGSTGLGLMPEGERKKHLKAVLKSRVTLWQKLGLSRREALKKAKMGYADKGMPNYQHRSFVADVFPEELRPPEPFTFTNNLSAHEAQKVIDNYLERYPKPKTWVSDYE